MENKTTKICMNKTLLPTWKKSDMKAGECQYYNIVQTVHVLRYYSVMEDNASAHPAMTTEEFLYFQTDLQICVCWSLILFIMIFANERWFQSNFYLELHNELQQGRHTHIFMRSHINIYRDSFKTRKIFDTLHCKVWMLDTLFYFQ